MYMYMYTPPLSIKRLCALPSVTRIHTKTLALRLKDSHTCTCTQTVIRDTLTVKEQEDNV